MHARSLAKTFLGVTAVLGLFAFGAPKAHAEGSDVERPEATMYATIWTYLDSRGHFLGNTGLNCDGGIFDYEGPVPDGSYARKTSQRCNVAEPAQVYCYFISQGAYGPTMRAISCTQMPGF
jgi:hypothetical protein